VTFGSFEKLKKKKKKY
jgi:chitin synthase